MPTFNPGINLSVDVSVVEKLKENLKAKPAAVRRVIRNTLSRTSRASARRVKANLRANRRTALLEKSEGQKVVTFGEVVVGIVGARYGFRQIVQGIGPVNPTNYDHLVEKGRRKEKTVPKKKKILTLVFKNLRDLFRFLDKFPKKGIVGSSRRPSRSEKMQEVPQFARILRRYGWDIASRVGRNKATGGGGGYVVFLNKVGPSPAFNPVERDENNFVQDSKQAVTNDLRAKFG